MVVDQVRHLDDDLRGLDALEIPQHEGGSWWYRALAALWPKLAAVGIVLLGWQVLFWSGIYHPWVIPSPATVFSELGGLVGTGVFWRAVGITMQRAAIGFVLAIAIGTILGLAVSQSSILRRAIGSLITGLQSMPSIVWFPFAILLLGLTEVAILFVMIIGAGPAIANGLISGVDHIPPILLRAGRLLGAKGPTAWRHVVLPAALPGYVAGIKQGWAFAWRSLMAGELLVIIASRPSIGTRLSFARDLADAPGLIGMMLVVLVIGIVVDGAVFGTLERTIRRNRGLLGA